MTADDKQLLVDNIQALGITLDQKTLDALLHYAAFLREWNERINLISRKDIDNLVPNHILDSLVALPLLQELLQLRHSEPAASPDHRRIDFDNKDRSFESKAGCNTQDDGDRSALRLMDLGPGGGFPGIPLKICLPEMELTMVEATQKKAKFLELVIPELGLTNTMVIPKHSRELAKDPAHIRKYDIVTARAVSELKDLVKDSFPFLAPGGRLLAYKSGKAEVELAAAQEVMKKLGGVIETGLILSTPVAGKERRILVVRKMAG
jgi:16S rRNA (guanine(527)-N(7))-methyltransferase RsmG